MKTGLITLLFCKALFCATAINNPFRISDLTFDPEIFSFRISWCIDSLGLKNGVSGGISVNFHKPGVVHPETFFLPVSKCGDTILHITDLCFDTTYTVELWGRYNEELLPPVTLSSKTIRVFSMIKQPVSFFDPSKSKDTVRVLNGKVMLWKDSDYLLGIPPHDDTIYYYKPDSKSLNGFIQVGTGVKFSKPEPSLPFYISLSIDSIPAICKSNQINIYYDSCGLMIPEPNSEMDQNGKSIKIKTSSIKYPFVVLADTLLPKYKMLSNASSVIDSAPLNDTIELKDNSANMTWSFYCAPGGSIPTKPQQSGIIKGTSGKIVCRFTSSGAQISGIRALLVISDGSNVDTVNLSKSGIRTNSDPYTTIEKTVMPFYTTAILDNQKMSGCFKSFFGSNTYDRSKFKIYRWAPSSGKPKDSNTWIEYNAKYDSLFQVKPGILYWLISYKSQLIDFGKGKTVPLTKPYTITLSPKNWTDCGNPFGFDLKLSDIFDLSSPDAEKIHIYSWKPAPAQKTYSASLLYSISVTDKTNDTIKTKGNGYTIYNPFDKPIELQFPPYPYGYQKRNLPKIKNNDGFSIKVTLRSGKDNITSVYCCGHTFNNDTILCPPSPSFSNSQLIIMNSDNQKYGIVSYPVNNSNVSSFEIKATEIEQHSPVSISAQFLHYSDPKNNMAILYKNQQITASDSAYISNYENDGIRILVGSSSNIKSFINKTIIASDKVPTMKSIYRNKHLLLNIDGVLKKQCVIELFDLQGKCVAKKEWFSDNDHVLKSLSLPGSGTYIVKINTNSGNFGNRSIIQKISCF